MLLDRLLGKLEEQGRHFEHRFNRLEVKVDELMSFRWKIYGFAALAAFLATAVIEIWRA